MNWVWEVGGSVYQTSGAAKGLGVIIIVTVSAIHHYFVCPIHDWIFVRHIRRLLEKRRVAR